MIAVDCPGTTVRILKGRVLSGLREKENLLFQVPIERTIFA
jgi:hypothetical protein